MRNVMKMSVLFREQVVLPKGLELKTEAFRVGWSLALSVDARQMENTINTYGWHFIKIADELFRYGVGKTSWEAVTNALTLSLSRVSENFNAVEVSGIELTQYPWFFLAKVQIAPFRLQQSSVLSLPDHYEPVPSKPRQRRLPNQAAALFSDFNSSMPQLKQLLVSSKTSQPRQDAR